MYKSYHTSVAFMSFPSDLYPMYFSDKAMHAQEQKNLGMALGYNVQLKMYIKIYKPFSTNNSCIMHLFYTPIYVPGVHCSQKYAPVSHQVPANQKSILLILFRKYAHCYQHSTKGMYVCIVQNVGWVKHW